VRIASQDIGYQGDALNWTTVDSFEIWDYKTIEAVVFDLPNVDKVGFISFEFDIIEQNSIPLGNVRNNFLSSSVACCGQRLRLLVCSLRAGYCHFKKK
jgi:hypothetical protein